MRKTAIFALSLLTKLLRKRWKIKHKDKLPPDDLQKKDYSNLSTWQYKPFENKETKKSFKLSPILLPPVVVTLAVINPTQLDVEPKIRQHLDIDINYSNEIGDLDIDINYSNEIGDLDIDINYSNEIGDQE